MAWYKTGTITVTNGSTTVSGAGTAWIANAGIGEALYAPDGKLYEISNIASDTTMTIAPAYLGATASAQPYVIVPSQSYIRDLAAQAADLVNNYSTIYNTVGQGKFEDGTLGTPAIRFSEDLDTGFYRSATNEVTFVAGGVAQFKYNTSGISFTTSPAFTTPISVTANSASNAFRITQTGTGNALLVEDSANPDSTPLVIDTDGRLLVGYTTSQAVIATGLLQVSGTTNAHQSIARFTANTASASFNLGKSRGATVGALGAVISGDGLGTINFAGDDGTAFIAGATIAAAVDGTPGTSDMPGRLVFATTADGASSPTERMRIDSAGRVGIGSVSTQASLAVTTTLPAASGFSQAFRGAVTYDPSVTTNSGYTFHSAPLISAGTLPTLRHFNAQQGTYTGSVTNQFGYFADSGLTGATNNYGFYGNIASGTGRYNFYANGTAENYFGGNTVVSVTDNTNAALRITQLGTGNALLVEDSANPDSTPFVVDSGGNVIVGASTSYPTSGSAPVFQMHSASGSFAQLGATSWASGTDTGASVSFCRSDSGAIGTHTLVGATDVLGNLTFSGSDGTNFIQAAKISASVDGTPGTNDMPGRLVFSTTADGASSPTEALRIDSGQRMGLGGTPSAFVKFNIRGTLPSASTASRALEIAATIPSTSTAQGFGFYTTIGTQAAAFTLAELNHYRAGQGTIGATSAVTNQVGFNAESTLTGATNNYGFYGNIASGANRYNFYAAGTADNYFAGATTIASVSDPALTVAGGVLIGSAATTTGTKILSGLNWNFSPLNIVRNAANNGSPRLLSFLLDGDNLASTTIGGYNAIWGIYNAAPTTGSTSSALQGEMAYASFYGHRWYINGTERMRIASTGTISLGAAPGAESLRVTPVASAVNYLNVVGSATGNGLGFSAQGTDTNINLVASSKGSGGIGVYSNNFANLQFNVAHTASAVNYLQVTGAATGSAPSIIAQGSDTNINLKLSSKGGAGVELNPGNQGTPSLVAAYVASPVNYAAVYGSATGNAIQFNALGSDTNISIALTPKGTGGVGIGTASPSTKFTVMGNANVVGNLYTPDYGYIGNSGGTFSGINTGFQTLSGASGYLTALTNGNERMRITSEGSVGIGTASPSSYGRLAVMTPTTNYGIFGVANSVGGGGGANLATYYGTTKISYIDTTLTNGTPGAETSFMAFATANSGTLAEKMRITSDGNLLVGTVGAWFDRKAVVEGQQGLVAISTVSGGYPISALNTATTGDNIFQGFWTEAKGSPTIRGNIAYNRAGGLVVYNTTSDRRAKDILGDVSDSGAVIDSLKVYNGLMKGATVARPMLIADEAQAVTPYAVTGEKDAVDSNGQPVFQQMDVSSYVPLLIAELQSLRKRVAELESI